MTGADIEAAAGASVRLLRSTTDRSWTAPVPDLDFTVSALVAHVAQCCIWYAVDLSSGGPDLAVIQPTVSDTGSPDQLIDSLGALARLLARVVDGAAPTDRGFHPFGQADASGFAAMACDEILVHTADLGTALGFELEPDVGVAERTLWRLFPWAPTDVEPWPALLWANGRIALPGRPRLERWRWQCAPLDEWDGEVPAPRVRR